MKKSKLGKKKLIHLADRVLNKPLYVEKSYAQTALSFFGGRAGFDFIVTQDERIPIKQSIFDVDEDKPEYDFHLRDDKTAVMSISGSLTHDGTGAHMMSSLGQGYNSIVNDARRIANNQDVERVAMMIGSNGGEVSGCSTCAETLKKIFSEAGVPVWAFVDENAYSAAYWQAVVADRIILPSSGGVGSVGTVLTHASYAKAIEQDGIEITLIHAGDKKVTGNPYKNLTQSDYDDLNSEIQYYGGLFRQGVNDLRPSLSLSKLEDAQAGTFPGQMAVDEGFADEVMNIDEFFNAFAEVERDSTTTISIGNEQMDKEELAALKAKAAKADELTKKLEQQEKDAQAKADKAEAEVNRFKEVLASDEAKGRREKALEILNDKDFSSLSADKVKTLLASMETDEPEKEEPKKEKEGEEEELHPDAKALLDQAKKNSATKDVESLGESKEASTVTTTNNKGEEDDKHRYSEAVEIDPQARMSSLLKSAEIVKANLARSTI